MRNRAPALRGEVGRGEPPDHLVVGEDPIAAHVRVIVAVDHHDLDAEAGQVAEQVRIAGGVRRRQHDPVDLPLAQHVELRALLLRVLVRAAEQQAVAARADGGLETGDDFHEEGGHQVGDDDAECVGAPERETAGDRVGLVAELGDLGEHPRARGVADVLAVVEDLGDGRDGHAELSGDPFHRGGGRHRSCVLRFALPLK